MLTALSRIWTLITMSFLYDNDYYIKSISICCIYIYICVCVCVCVCVYKWTNCFKNIFFLNQKSAQIQINVCLLPYDYKFNLFVKKYKSNVWRVYTEALENCVCVLQLGTHSKTTLQNDNKKALTVLARLSNSWNGWQMKISWDVHYTSCIFI